MQKADELDMAPQELKAFALKSPKAFFNMVGINPQQTETGTVYNGGRQAGPSNVKPEVRNKAWYDAKKREMGVKKFILDRALNLQMHQDAQTLGDAFYN